MANRSCPTFGIPKVIAELGPGDSIGIGLAALISGAEKYYAFDVVKHANTERNLKIFDELVVLFRKRENIPGFEEFPELKPYLNSYSFPRHILTDTYLEMALDDKRLDMIKEEILQGVPKSNKMGIQIKYVVPWYEKGYIREESVDLIYSQAVLEHIDDLDYAYQIMRKWLKQDGIMSHQIDFKSHETAKHWNGHWVYSDLAWRMLRGNRAYLINRQPLSAHIKLLEKNDFKIICSEKITNNSGIKRDELSDKFGYLTQEDLFTSGVFIQAVKNQVHKNTI